MLSAFLVTELVLAYIQIKVFFRTPGHCLFFHEMKYYRFIQQFNEC